jgi:hypothetical protein
MKFERLNWGGRTDDDHEHCEGCADSELAAGKAEHCEGCGDEI